MTERHVHVTAPSRLHFGMFSAGRAGKRQFGGVGAMVSSPGLRLRIRPSDRLEAAGLLTERTIEIARRTFSLRDQGNGGGESKCRIEVTTAARQHVGLGTGTQLAMAVAAGLNAFWGEPELEAAELARSVGRGERSAIGLYGFVHGGLLLEGGKTECQNISPLVRRVDLPDSWRFLLICPKGITGLSGEAESQAFAKMPPVPERKFDALYRQASLSLLPAAQEGRFDDFSDALYEFGYTAGLGFAHEQGGPFAGRRLTDMVERIRELGIHGVGQSSWGPTLFVVFPDEPSTYDFLRCFGNLFSGDEFDLTIAEPDNTGAQIKVVDV
jgi:beta-RFAP synthase